MEQLTPIQKIDTVLKCLWENNSKRLNLEEIATILNREKSGVDFGEINNILDKLYQDGKIKMEMTQEREYYYRVTFEGSLFIEQGGYTQQQTERDYNAKLAANLRRLQYHTWWLTVVIAVGTTVAAVYYAIEVYKYFSCPSR